MFNHIKCHASIELTVEVGPGLNAVEYYVFNGAFILFFFSLFSAQDLGGLEAVSSSTGDHSSFALVGCITGYFGC